MAKVRMGFEGEIFYGVAGSTGSTRIVNCRDITINYTNTTVATKARGNSDVPPQATHSVVERNFTVDFTMRRKDGDAVLGALLAAMDAGDPVALRLTDHAAGMGPDADFYLSSGSDGKGLDNMQEISFTAEPTDDADRAPQMYV